MHLGKISALGAALAAFGFAQPFAFAADPYGDFMPAELLGARSWVAQHPTLDGRGLVVAVLDTGVDPRASGLEKTSTGAVKVIEARDFTGQGDVNLEQPAVKTEGSKVSVSIGETSIRDLEQIAKEPIDGRWLLGTFSETQIGPEALRDLNRNGKSNDNLALLVWRVGPNEDDVRAILDLNGDGSAAGETIVRPYHVAKELWIAQTPHPNKDLPLLSLAFECDWAGKKASLHFTDGSHGTHVAGIIAGFRIHGKDDWNGVAPGAQILSLKIGHNALAGGATTTESFKKALEFAARWSRQNDMPIVVNASYGIASVIEAQADLDRFVDQLVQANPLVTIAFSAGNLGPGISSIGSPAAADLALAVGAVLPKDSAPTLYGGQVDQHEIFAFSSRGGELNKPEIVAPGTASSSVPVWDGQDMKNGTSMSSPAAAGAMLLVWSALMEDYKASQAKAAQDKTAAPAAPHSGIVRRALVWSARPLPNYTLLDQGHGLVHVGRAVALARRLLLRPEAVATIGYHIESAAPRPDGHKMPASYWRAGAWLPDNSTTTRTDIKAILPGTTSAAEREKFAAAFELTAQGDFFELVRNRVLLRGDRTAPIEIRLKSSKLTAPGTYIGRVIAKEIGALDDEAAFESWQVVIVPQRFSSLNKYRARWSDVSVKPGKIWHQFVLTPPGATHMQVRAIRRDGQYADAQIALFDPEGQRTRPTKRMINTREGVDADWVLGGSAMMPGTWELTLAGNIVAAQESHVDVEVSFTTAEIDAPRKFVAKDGGAAQGKLTVTNTGELVFVGSARGQISRLSKQEKVTVKGDHHNFDVTLGAQFGSARLQLHIDKNTYNLATDWAVVVRDSSGHDVANGGFNGTIADISWRKVGTAEQKYAVAITGGFAHKPKEDWKLQIEQDLELAKAIPLNIATPAGGVLMAYPYVPLELTVKATEAWPAPPAGFVARGDVEFWWSDGQHRWLTTPIPQQ